MCWLVRLVSELVPSERTKKQRSIDPADRQSSLQARKGISPSTEKKSKDLTVERIVFDTVWILPMGTADGEHSARRAIQREDRTISILRRLIENEVQGT